MSANLPEVGDEVITTGQAGREAGERHVVRSIDDSYVWTRASPPKYRSTVGNEPTAREHFWLVFQRAP